MKRLFAAAFATLALSFTLGMSGCDKLKTVDPVTPAVQSGNPEVIAFALEGSYTIVQSKAADVAEDANTPENVKKVIACVAEKANPIFDKARPLAVEAEDLRVKIKAGGSGAERLAIILKDLNKDVNDVAPLISDLVAAVSGKAQGVCAP